MLQNTYSRVLPVTNEQRRSQRFRIDLPVEITQLSGKRVNRFVSTFDISSGGISFLSSKEWETGSRVEFFITLNAGKKVRIRCLGKIIRVESVTAGPDMNYKVVATIDRYEFLRGGRETAERENQGEEKPEPA